MRSDVLGYLERGPRTRYCRMTAFTLGHIELYEAVIPFARAVDRVFRRLAPDRWKAQHNFVSTVQPDFVIPGTVFTSITLNQTERMAAHADRGDYRPGLGVLI